MKRKLFAVTTAMLLPLAIFAQEEHKGRPKIEARIVPDTVLIGDQPVITVTVDKDIAQMIDIPDLGFPEGSPVEMLECSAVDTVREGRREKLTRRYRVTPFTQGDVTLHGIPVLYIDKNIVDTLASDSLRLYVTPIEINAEEDEIYDIKGIRPMPVIWKEISGYFWWTLLALAVIAAVVYLVRRFAKVGSILPQQPELPPHIVAINRLEQIKGESLWQAGKVKLYYTKVTDVIREYLEKRYGINAMEMTSEEILETVAGYIDRKGKDYRLLRDLLAMADIVKFAKGTPSPIENQGAYDDAYYFVELTKQVEPVRMEEEVSDGQK